MDGLGLGTLAGLLACGLVHSALGLGGGRVVTGLEVTVVATGLPCFMHVALLTDGEAGTDEEGRDFAVDFKQHFLEEVETLEFVDQERVFLLIAGILYTGLQFVEFAQVVFPEVVDNGKGDAFLDAELNPAALVLVRLFDGGDHIEGLFAVGDGESNVDVVGILVDVLDEGVGEVADALHA